MKPAAAADQVTWSSFALEMKKQALRTFILFPLPLSLAVAAVISFADSAKGESTAFLSTWFGSFVTAYPIGFCIYALYGLYYAVLTASKYSDAPLPAWLRKHERNLFLHFALSGVGISLGIAASGPIVHQLKHWIWEHPLPQSQWVGSQAWQLSFLWALILGLILCLFFAFAKSRDQLLQIEKSDLEAYSRTLSEQMKPHFLFNMFNGLSELTLSDPVASSEAQLLLADLYRMILDQSGSSSSTLEQELRIVMTYLNLQKVRFGARLGYSLEIELSTTRLHAVDELSEYPESGLCIPGLTLQTLVENALKHGIEKSKDGGVVFIGVDLRNRDCVQVLIRNSGAPLDAHFREGTGLQNTRKRLSLRYQDKASLQISQNSSKMTEFALRFPAEWERPPRS